MLKDRRVVTIVGIALLAVAVGNWMFFRSLSAPKHPARQATSVVNVNPEVPIRTLSSGVFPLDEFTVSVQPIDGPWSERVRTEPVTQDPFRAEPKPGARSAVEAGPAPVRRPKFSVTAVLTSGTQKVAIINNEPVAVGDHVDGLRVSEITLDRVVLGVGESRQVIHVE